MSCTCNAPPKVEIKLMNGAPADFLPQYATIEAAGLDLKAWYQGFDKWLYPGERLLIGTGIAVHIADPGIAMVLIPRSGLGTNGLVLANLVGLIDSDYQGEVLLSLWNSSGRSEFRIKPGARLAQAIFVPILRPRLEIVTEFSETTERGANGFGHTGT